MSHGYQHSAHRGEEKKHRNEMFTASALTVCSVRCGLCDAETPCFTALVVGLTCSCRIWTFCPAAGRFVHSLCTGRGTSPGPEAGSGGIGPGTHSRRARGPSAGFVGRTALLAGPHTYIHKSPHPAATLGHSWPRSAHSGKRSHSYPCPTVYLAHTTPIGRSPQALFQMDRNESMTLFSCVRLLLTCVDYGESSDVLTV